jgi:chemotaxis protein MotB
MASRDRYSQQSSSIWSGYVDALSALLVVVIFVLLIFTFSQFILSYILFGYTGRLPFPDRSWIQPAMVTYSSV